MNLLSVLAIDPGPEQSAWVIFEANSQKLLQFDIQPNQHFLEALKSAQAQIMVLEQIASFGMPVGAEVFETVFWSGRFAEAWGREFHRVKRHEVKMHLCHNMRAKDANIRQALIDRFGPVGTKKAPGRLYGISKDLWSALAIAVTWSDRVENQPGFVIDKRAV